MNSPTPCLDDDWVLEQIRKGCYTTQDVLNIWNSFLDEPLNWCQTRYFKNKCNHILTRLERYGYVERFGRVMQAHAMHTVWRLKE